MQRVDRWLHWWKQDKRYVLLGKALLAALLPFLCCLVSCAVQGRRIGQVYLPSSPWNDELFYYKQVESIVRFGYPYGYYGFNESHGLVLSFAAWSPVLVLPWIVWGLLFGWNLLSPVLCNILLMTSAMLLFVLLARPTWKQLGILTLLFCLYTPFVRYMLSGMPEIICISHLIVFYGLVYSYCRKEAGWKLFALFVISGLLTLMRPYMLLFLLLAAVFMMASFGRKGKLLLGMFCAAAATGAVLFVYALIKHFFGAEYFHPLFFTDWITTFFTDGFGAGVHNFFSTLYWKGKDFKAHTVQGLRTGLASGAFFAGYLVTMAVLLWQSVADYRKQKQRLAKARGTERYAQFVAEAHLAFSFIGMLFALLLMYKLTEGSKHLLTFMAVGVCVVSMMDTRFFKKAVLLGATFAYLYTYMAVDPYDYQVPFVTQERQEQVEDWRDRFARSMTLDRAQVPNYENVAIWVFNEQSAAGETMKWQLLYALPEGFGISCCQKDFVLEQFDQLQSGYIVAQTGAEVDQACAAAGWTLLEQDQDIVLYKRP
ncbi:MAG: hypothetical protein IJ747_08230 [Lachnospiraceae bacterium]|nr:hypothetical protein [Lachnospiraceae bacterium]